MVLTDPGALPANWRPAVDVEEGETAPLTEPEFAGSMPAAASPNQANLRIRYCRKCNQPKPPRCHHCSVCESCVSTCIYFAFYFNVKESGRNDVFFFGFLALDYVFVRC